MENKITLEGLIAEMRQETYDAGYNEGYTDGAQIPFKALRKVADLIHGRTKTKDTFSMCEAIQKILDEALEEAGR